MTPVSGLQNPTLQEKFVIWLYFMDSQYGPDITKWRATPELLEIWCSLHEVKLK